MNTLHITLQIFGSCAQECIEKSVGRLILKGDQQVISSTESESESSILKSWRNGRSIWQLLLYHLWISCVGIMVKFFWDIVL